MPIYKAVSAGASLNTTLTNTTVFLDVFCYCLCNTAADRTLAKFSLSLYAFLSDFDYVDKQTATCVEH